MNQQQMQSIKSLPNPSTLGRIAYLRQQMSRMESQIEALTLDAIAEAFEVLKAKNSDTKIVYDGSEAKIILVLKKRIDLKDRVVMRLSEDISAEVIRLSKLGHEELKSIDAKVAKLKKQVESLHKKRDSILTSSYLLKLKKHHKIACDSASYLSPSLSVYVK